MRAPARTGPPAEQGHRGRRRAGDPLEGGVVPSQIVVLNGASSAGKSSLVRALQRRLDPGWFMLGVGDPLAAVLPFGDDPRLFEVTSGGFVRTTDALRRAEAA